MAGSIVRCGVALTLVACLGSTAHAGDIGEDFNDAVGTLLKEGYATALPKFAKLVGERFAELSPKGQHGAATIYALCLAKTGKTGEAKAKAAWFYAKQPKSFTSLAQFSGSESADAKTKELRGAIKMLALQTGKGKSVLYLHNSSEKPIVISDSKYDVNFGYSSKETSVGNMTTNGSPAFQGSLTLPKGGGAIVESSSGGGFLAAALPDVISILAYASTRRLPDWIHLIFSDYTQTLTKVHLTATVKWGEEELKDVLITELDQKPAEKVEEKPSEKPAEKKGD